MSIFELEFSPQQLSFSSSAEIFPSNCANSDGVAFYAFDKGKISKYRKSSNASTFVEKWAVALLANEDIERARVLYLPQTLECEKGSLILLKTKEGISFYKYDDNQIEFLTATEYFEENIFHDVHLWDEPGNMLKAGRFYKDKNLIGIVSKHEQQGLTFHAVVRKELDEGRYPVWSVELDTSTLGNITTADIFLADVLRTGQENVVIRSGEGIRIYRFNENNELEELIVVTEGGKRLNSNQAMFFPTLTGQDYSDIVAVNSSGLFIFKHEPSLRNYALLHYSPLFSDSMGWNQEHIASIQFVDVNSDGKHEMAFTGPRGIDLMSLDAYTGKLLSFLRNNKLTIAQRHSKTFSVASSGGGGKNTGSLQSIILTRRNNRTDWADIVGIEELGGLKSQATAISVRNSSSPVESQTIGVIPELLELPPEQAQIELLLRDQLDFSSLLDAVDSSTGRLKFRLPLINLQGASVSVKQDIFYDGTMRKADFMGVGWYMPLSFITRSHQSSIFPHDATYYLVIQNTPQQLKLDHGKTTKSVSYFKLANASSEKDESDLQIAYFKDEERWHVSHSGETQIYGRSHASDSDPMSDPVQWELTWTNWRGLGKSYEGMMQIATSWYLTETSDKRQGPIRYSYDSINIPVAGSNVNYTREIYLKSMADSNGNGVSFTYSDKNSMEYRIQPIVDQNGQFTPRAVQTRFLASYKVSTNRYCQDVEFKYELSGGTRLLTGISQKSDVVAEPVVRFGYKKMDTSHVIDTILMPTGVKLEYSYELLGKSKKVPDEIGRRFGTSSKYRVDEGMGFVLLSYVDKQGQIVLRMFNDLLTEELYSSVDPSARFKFPLVGHGHAKDHEVLLGSDYFAILVIYTTDKALYLFRKEETRWSLLPQEFIFKDTHLVQPGSSFFVVGDTKKTPEVIDWNNKTKMWQKQSVPNLASGDVVFATEGRTVVVYDNRNLVLRYLDTKDEWQSEVLVAMPGLFTAMKEALDQFDVLKDDYKSVLDFFKGTALQLSGNLILFKTWQLQGSQLKLVLRLFTIGENYEIAERQDFIVDRDNLESYVKEISFPDIYGNESFFDLAYKRVNNKFQVYVKQIRGKIMKDLEDLSEEQEEIRKEAEASYKRQILDEAQKRFLLDLKNYMASLVSTTVGCFDRKYIFNGRRWVQEASSEVEKQSILAPLGENLMLVKEGENSNIKLFSQNSRGQAEGRPLVDLGTRNMTQTLLRVMAPNYLAYQEGVKPTGIVQFSSDLTVAKAYKLRPAETLSKWTLPNILVTHIYNFGPDDSFTVVMRKGMDLHPLTPNAVIVNSAVVFDGGASRRETGFEYDFETALGSGGAVYYKKSSVISGNRKDLFGHVEFTRGDTMETRYFDSKGQLVKLEVRESTGTESDEHRDGDNGDAVIANSTIYDSSGMLEVAQFFPYTVASEEVSYYGFEDYEVNAIGEGVKNEAMRSEKKWFFSQSDVVKGGFPFTGRNYLTLKETMLIGTFQPANQIKPYLASAWMRATSGILKLETPSPYLKAIVLSEDEQEICKLLAEVKFKTTDWYYLEVVIDLLEVKSMVDAFNSDSGSINSTTVNLKVAIVVSAPENATLDVDHIRFSPLSAKFSANVYDVDSRLVKQKIGANGLVKRYFHDRFNEEIASINEYGEFESIRLYSKTSSLGLVEGAMTSFVEIKPETGFYEDFAPYSFWEQWTIDAASSWRISPGQLHHMSMDSNTLQLKLDGISPSSAGVRMTYDLKGDQAMIKFKNGLSLDRTGNKASISVGNSAIPVSGDLVAMNESNRLIVWIDGIVRFDGFFTNSALFPLQVRGKVTLSDVLVFGNPFIQVTYLNDLDEKVQEVWLEGPSSAIVTEYLYDQLGRQSINTRPGRVERIGNLAVLKHYDDFVSNKDPRDPNSVWKVGELRGLSVRSVGSNGYSEKRFADNPLEEEYTVGLPGKAFNVNSTVATRHTSQTNVRRITTRFPTSKTFKYSVEHRSGYIEEITVLDPKDKKVAWCVEVPGRRGVLGTYEYNEKGKMVKLLPPLYHEQAEDLNLLKPTKRNETEALEAAWGTHMSYDGQGRLISKLTPDTGKTEHVYNKAGLRKYTLYYDNNGRVKDTIFYEYDNTGNLIGTGRLQSSTAVPKDKLLDLTLTSNNTEPFQQFQYSHSEEEPLLRQKLTQVITLNEGVPFYEELYVGSSDEVLSKRTTVKVQDSKDPLLIAINKRYRAGKVVGVEYPMQFGGEPFAIAYSRDMLGRLTELRLHRTGFRVASFKYNAAGQVVAETILPDTGTNFTRYYSYNEPGFLTKLQDKFLTEKVFYTEGSYGDTGYSDGTITRTEFQATWHQDSDESGLGLQPISFVSQLMTRESSATCFQKLKEAGYLNELNRQVKAFYPEEALLPTMCTTGTVGRQIQKKLGEQGFPSNYGHSYSYGNYKELVRAKYFVGDENPRPLQPLTLEEELGSLNKTAISDVWEKLNRAKYLIDDNRKTIQPRSYGTEGKSFLRESFFTDLSRTDTALAAVGLQLQRFLADAFANRRDVSWQKGNLRKAFLVWNDWKDRAELLFQKMIKMLESNRYFENPLSEEFKKLMSSYSSYTPDIVRVLLKYFARQLGKSEFDVQSYEIDANGNHKKFYTGFERYELLYRSNSNQINQVKLIKYSESVAEKTYVMEHDNRGNVVRALHKGIERIEYHAVSNRATKFHLTDGRSVVFHYDSHGERVLKRVVGQDGEVIKEIHYVRDERHRVLMEKEVSYIIAGQPPDVRFTAYIYGPRGLLGFVRRGEFFTLITDHEGSVRLVIRGDEVVAAYDYLPYGGLMRIYGRDPDSHIAYRYTGQEWDEELGLYNYHARFYDPAIGRFYQTDPKDQYFSPYKYAGNSPISMVDPDGEFALFLIPFIIGGLIAGAYLGGAAANGFKWDPTKWKWNARTIVGMIFGGIGGALLPVGFAASTTVFAGLALKFGASSIASYVIGASVTATLGIAGAILNMAAVSGTFDMSKWAWKSPALWNAAFTGFSMGSGLAGGVQNLITFYKSLGTIAQRVFSVSSVLVGGGLIAKNAIAYSKDKNLVAFLVSFVNIVTVATDLPMFLSGSWKFLAKDKGAWNNMIAFINFVKGDKTIVNAGRNLLLSIGKMSAGAAGAGIFIYLSGSGASNSWGSWDWTSPETYFSIIDGMVMGAQLANTPRMYYKQWKNTKSLPDKREAARLSKAEEQTRQLALTFMSEYQDVINTGTKKINIEGSTTVYAKTSNVDWDKPPQMIKVNGVEEWVLTSKNGEPNIKIAQRENGKFKFLPHKDLIQPKPFLVTLLEMMNREQNIQFKYPDAINDKLKKGKLPNNVVTVSVTDKIATIGFSGTRAPGALIYVDLADPTSLNFRISPYNKEFAGKQIKWDANILNELEALSENAKNHLLETFDNDIAQNVKVTLGEEVKALSLTAFKNDKEGKYKEAVQTMLSNAYDEFVGKLRKHILYSKDQKGLKNNMKNSLKDLIKKMEPVGLDKQGKAMVDNFKNHVMRLSEKIVDNILQKTGGLSEEFAKIQPTWDKHGYPEWDPSNCAEVNAIWALENPSMQDGKTAFSIPYKQEDIKFMATYDVPNTFPDFVGPPKLEAKERCNNCKVTTSKVPKVLTDPDVQDLIANYRWNKQFTDQTAKHIRKLYSYWSRNYFCKVGTNVTDYNMPGCANDRSTRSVRKISIGKETPVYDSLFKVAEGGSKSLMINSNVESKPSNETSWFKRTVRSVADRFTPSLFLGQGQDNLNASTAPKSVNASADVNGAIMLLDLVVRKFTGQKHVCREEESISVLEVQTRTLMMLEKFEGVLEEAASQAGILESPSIDPVSLAKVISTFLRQGKCSKIVDALFRAADEACPPCYGKGDFLERVKAQVESWVKASL